MGQEDNCSWSALEELDAELSLVFQETSLLLLHSEALLQQQQGLL